MEEQRQSVSLAASAPHLPMLPRHGATEADGRALLRAVWMRVLQLHAEELKDSMPFAAFGGDSLTAALMHDLCRAHGLILSTQMGFNVETMTVDSIIRNARSWRGEGFVRPERQRRRLISKQRLQLVASQGCRPLAAMRIYRTRQAAARPCGSLSSSGIRALLAAHWCLWVGSAHAPLEISLPQRPSWPLAAGSQPLLRIVMEVLH